jgi:hypothetical protein
MYHLKVVSFAATAALFSIALATVPVKAAPLKKLSTLL